jgi:hypothetical protein
MVLVAETQLSVPVDTQWVCWSRRRFADPSGVESGGFPRPFLGSGEICDWTMVELVGNQQTNGILRDIDGLIIVVNGG